MSVVAETLSVSRSNLHDRLKGGAKPRRRYHKAQDAAVVLLITALVAARPPHGYRRITALLNRRLRAEGSAPVNHKRVYRIMKKHSLLLARRYTERLELTHEGKEVTMRSNVRWCSDGFEFTWLGTAMSSKAHSTIVLEPMANKVSFIDAQDREIISWRAVVNAGISRSDIRDMMLEAVEQRFGDYRTPHPVDMLSDNGSCYIVKETRIFARQIGLKPCYTPVKSPQSNGIAEAFVEALKCNYVHVAPLPDAAAILGLIAGWFEDFNEQPPTLGPEDALTARVHRTSNRNRLSVR